MPADPAADLPWAAYARHSDRKQDRSVPQQIEQFNAYAAAHDLTLPANFIFRDEARSGKSDVGRAGLVGLMSFLERRPRPVAGVMLWASSRLARNVDDSAWYKAGIRRMGYKLLYVGDTLLNTEGPERHIFEALHEYKDAKYLEDLAREVKRGMHSRAAARAVICRPARGYRVAGAGEARRFEIDPAWEGAVRRAWAMRAAGYTLADVHTATQLFAVIAGYQKFFRNLIYRGTLVWGGAEYDNFCEPLATAEQWARVQALNAVRTHPRRARSVFLLSGRVWCVCGAAMKGRTHATGKYTYRYHRCQRTAWEPAACTRVSVRADWLEAEVTRLAQAEFTPARLAPVYAAWRERRAREGDQAAGELERHKRQLLAATRAIENLLRAIEAAGDDSAAIPALTQQLAEREAERKVVRQAMAACLPPVAGADFDLDDYCAGIQALLASGDPSDRRTVLRALAHQVIVAPGSGPERLRVVFNRLPF